MTDKKRTSLVAALFITAIWGMMIGGMAVPANAVTDATISGTVYDSSGIFIGQPIVVIVFTGDPCNPVHVDNTVTDPANGTYTIPLLSAGTYYLRTWNNGAPYLDEWWADPESVIDCNNALEIAVAAGETVSDKDFQLDAGATISGIVKDSAGAAITVGGSVWAYTGNPCSYNWVVHGSINPNTGAYTITGLPTGSYYLRANPYSNYTGEWWASPSSVPDCTGAQAISVTAGDAEPGVWRRRHPYPQAFKTG